MNQQKKEYRQNHLYEGRQKDNESYYRTSKQQRADYQLNKKIVLQNKEYRNKNKTQPLQTNDDIII